MSILPCGSWGHKSGAATGQYSLPTEKANFQKKKRMKAHMRTSSNEQL